MKVLKQLCLLSLVVFPLAPASQQPLPLAAEPAECALSSTENLCGRCGDGQCVKSCGETATSCPADCGGVPR
jgi:hypothetical protein